ncbi:MAG: hypothetical protein CSA18_00400 [Deltaproteobacteria bacterium]|nr:MAG: hypothetical protein CSA18_00400 [Deltaproteobacteria bacterium]
MCLIIFLFNENQHYPLIIAANRDEFYNRETKSADIWGKDNSIIAGRDLQSLGTWMGINKNSGRFAAITNYRDPSMIKTEVKSRGVIVSSYLESELGDEEFIYRLKKEKDNYNGFNFIFGDLYKIYHYSNISDEITIVNPGIHGVSNHLLDSPWPKLLKAKKRLSETFKSDEIINSSFDVLKDSTAFHDSELPETGMDIKWERILSPIFVKSEIYGTRSSTIILFCKNGDILFIERAFIDEKITKETKFIIKKCNCSF